MEFEYDGIEYDEAKRLKILKERGLDLAESGLVFQGSYTELLDDRKDYGELRFRVWGYLHGQRVSVVWTPRGQNRRIITMRHAHEPEHSARHKTLD
jgi:uncharacterized DUF497 family protein